MPILGYNVETGSPKLRSLQDELIRLRGGLGIGYSRSTDPDPEGLRQLELEAEIGDELRRIGSTQAEKYPHRDLSAAALYLGQHFPKYAAEHRKIQEPTLRPMLERGIIAPKFTRPVIFGAGSKIAQPKTPEMETGYGGQMPQMYYPRVMAQGQMPTASAPQARPGVAPTPTLPMGPAAQPSQPAFMWASGPEGQELYDEWYWQTHPFSTLRK